MKINVIFVILNGLIWTNVLAQSDFTCDPATDCTNAGFAGAKVPDPYDCESYYVCLLSSEGTLVPSFTSLKCPNGQFFDQISTECANETSPGDCFNQCLGNIFCETQCSPYNGSITIVAEKSNCSYYTICLQSGPSRAVCPDNSPYFDGSNCVSDKTQCCDFCTVYCSEVGIQIQDPCDCTSFYICFELGTPTTRINCGSGHYDETAGNCIPGTCTSICSGTQCGVSSVMTSSTTNPFISTKSTIDPSGPPEI